MEQLRKAGWTEWQYSGERVRESVQRLSRDAKLTLVTDTDADDEHDFRSSSRNWRILLESAVDWADSVNDAAFVGNAAADHFGNRLFYQLQRVEEPGQLDDFCYLVAWYRLAEDHIDRVDEKGYWGWVSRIAYNH